MLLLQAVKGRGKRQIVLDQILDGLWVLARNHLLSDSLMNVIAALVHTCHVSEASTPLERRPPLPELMACQRTAPYV